MNDIDDVARRAVTALLDDVDRRVDVDRALRDFTGIVGVDAAVRLPSPRRQRRAVLVAVSVFAVAAIVVGFVVVAGHGGHSSLNPTNSAPSSEEGTTSSTTPRSPRSDATITDAQAIDLDKWLTGAPVWPKTSAGPYTIFDVSSFPKGWTVTSAGGGTEIPSPVRDAQWHWAALVTSPDGVHYSVEVRSIGVLPDETGDSTDPVEVRGHDGTASSGRIRWHETGNLAGSVVALEDGDHRAEMIALANALRTTTVAQLPGRDDSSQGTDVSGGAVAQLGGLIGGRGWSVTVTTTPSLSMSVHVDNWKSGGGFGASENSSGAVSTINLAVNGVPGGVMVYGAVPATVTSVRAELSDGVAVTLPVYTWTDATAFAVPIPDGLDVTAIAYLDSAGTVLHRTLLPEFAVPTTGGLGGSSDFGDPTGTNIYGGHTSYDFRAPLSTADPTDQSLATTGVGVRVIHRGAGFIPLSQQAPLGSL